MFDKEEIVYHVVNSAIAGSLVFLGYFVGSGEMITIKGILISLAASGIVAISKFKDYWGNEKDVFGNKKKKTGRKTRILAFI